jgi:DNA-binding Xre family transcriptional regulator
LKKDKALGINFETLEKICEALKCQPGDILALPAAKKAAKKSVAGRRNGRTRK